MRRKKRTPSFLKLRGHGLTTTTTTTNVTATAITATIRKQILLFVL
jgi:hypothetical protein